MNNNDVLRNIRFTFDLNDDKMMKMCSYDTYEATRTEISAWLKRDDDPDFVEIPDKNLSIFLNSFIEKKRGKKEGVVLKPDKYLNNNIILRKLKIALNLKVEEMVEIYKYVGMRVSIHEINAFFRKPEQRQYRKCLDQFLRKFLHGIQIKYKGAV
ncbi:UNVERIFIED_CONTAM: hypothetical protein GTU68_028677 [Idotea baltica]|nr:hypothetical protein [Idotea baltica]